MQQTKKQNGNAPLHHIGNGNVDNLPVLLITANLGSLFEMEEIINDWVDEFIKVVFTEKPVFIAMHCQEIGGKKATPATIQLVEDFYRNLLKRPIMTEFDRSVFFLDDAYDSSDYFTALGSLCIAHRSVSSFGIWDYRDNAFVDVSDHSIRSFRKEQQIDQITCSRFPPDLHPLGKGNRKGFMKARCFLDGRIVDFINAHMYYDECNLVAMESVPSQYSAARRAAFRHILDTQCSEEIPFFLFGDFNFRLDAHNVVKKLTANGIRQEIVQQTLIDGLNGSDQSPKARIRFVENDDLEKIILTVEKKLFDHHDQHDVAFQLENGRWLREFDNEFEAFRGELHEFDVNFPPSYPYVEERGQGKFFMKTRCPAWCDRVIMSRSAFELISKKQPVQYDMIGRSVCMGDHKPVYLSCSFVPAGESTSSDEANGTVSLCDKQRKTSSSLCDGCSVV